MYFEELSKELEQTGVWDLFNIYYLLLSLKLKLNLFLLKLKKYLSLKCINEINL
jgi:hypothetical protein